MWDSGIASKNCLNPHFPCHTSHIPDECPLLISCRADPALCGGFWLVYLLYILPGVLVFLEILAEMGSQFLCLPVVFGYIIPGIDGVKNVIWHPRAVSRHFQFEHRMGNIVCLVQFAVYRSPYHCPCVFKINPFSGAVGSSGPAGVYKEYVYVVLLNFSPSRLA